MAGGVRVQPEENGLSIPKGTVSRNQREPLCTATPWINHPMGPTGGVTNLFSAPNEETQLGVHFLGRSNPSGTMY